MNAPFKHAHLGIKEYNEFCTLEPLETACIDWLANDAMPLWWKHGFNWQGGIWNESLNSSGLPTNENHRARVQGRQTYAFSLIETMGIPGPWSINVHAGFSGINAKFVGETGFLRSVLGADGTPLDETNKLYDQTFVLLAWSSSRKLIEDASSQASALMTKIIDEYGNRAGDGLVEKCTVHPFQSNAHMHLFEASLSWAQSCWEDGVSGEKWEVLAEEIATLAATKFVDQKGLFLREFFNSNWEPKRGVDGTVVEPGHQFEWAWLFARWAKFSKQPEYLHLAKNLFRAGLMGIHPQTGAAVNTMNENLEPVTQMARLWPQTEWLKAALVLFEESTGPERETYLKQVEQAHTVLMRFLETNTPGLWFDVLNGENQFEKSVSPASSLYHIVGAINQLHATCSRLRVLKAESSSPINLANNL